MSYIDTSVIVAALDPADPRRPKALKELEDREVKLISELVVTELSSLLSRREELISKLASKLNLSEELTVIAVLFYIMRRFGLKYVDVIPESRMLPLGRLYSPMAIALELATDLRLKTLDLLHASYVKLMKETGTDVNALVTADRDFQMRREELKDSLKVEVFLIE